MDIETLDDMSPEELMDFWVKHQGGRGSKLLFPGMRKAGLLK